MLFDKRASSFKLCFCWSIFLWCSIRALIVFSLTFSIFYLLFLILVNFPFPYAWFFLFLLYSLRTFQFWIHKCRILKQFFEFKEGSAWYCCYSSAVVYFCQLWVFVLGISCIPSVYFWFEMMITVNSFDFVSLVSIVLLQNAGRSPKTVFPDLVRKLVQECLSVYAISSSTIPWCNVNEIPSSQIWNFNSVCFFIYFLWYLLMKGPV